jgi:hypothetical protein
VAINRIAGKRIGVLQIFAAMQMSCSGGTSYLALVRPSKDHPHSTKSDCEDDYNYYNCGYFFSSPVTFALRLGGEICDHRRRKPATPVYRQSAVIAEPPWSRPSQQVKIFSFDPSYSAAT